jgi:ketosteroid isomerase-like protein
MSHYEAFPEQAIFRGYEGLRKFLSLLHEDIGVVDNRALEVIDLGDDRVFVMGSMTIRGATSGVVLDGPPFGQVIEFRDGLICRVDNYSDAAEARRAAGLPEE